MNRIMIEFTLWSENPEVDIDNISKIINIFPVEIESIGDIKYYGEKNNLKRYVDVSSLMYSTDYINTIEVEYALKKMFSLINPSLSNLINIVNEYKLNSKFCIVIDTIEKPIISLPSDIIKTISQLSAEIDFDFYNNYD
ncbi:MAG: DUF4279 domain-containing protein [Ruminococcus sp.]|nr:DUF4279 domain-containing protein [Ruminococcus sp.]MDD6709591.1 DUF4279 domain-containing protein [Ruminococcus sp.]